MRRYCSAILALPFALASFAHAQPPGLCAVVAHHLWSQVATAPLHEQTPLAALITAAPAAFRIGGKDFGKPGQSVADALGEVDFAGKLRGLPPTDAMRFGDTDIWLLDRVEGTLGCHSVMAVAVPPTGPAREVGLPAGLDPTVLCALSALTAVTIDGTPALWIEQSGAFSNVPDQSTITIAELRDAAFTPPCTMVVDYAVTDHATHAFCDGVDCVPLIRAAELLAMRLRQKETADSLGAGAIGPGDDATGYRRMAELAAADKSPAELPTFGAPVETPYLTFADQVMFPLRLNDGLVYLVRLGNGGFGWRRTADTLLALYRLRDDRLVPAASVYVSAPRTAIAAVTIQ